MCHNYAKGSERSAFYEPKCCGSACVVSASSLFFALPAVTRATAHRTKHFHGHSMPGLLLGDVFPDFEAETTTGTIKLHEFLGDS